MIDLQPLGVVPHELWVDGAIDMVQQAKLAERGVKELPPDGVGVVTVVEDDRHAGADVNVLKSGRNDLGRGRISKGVGGRGAGGGGWAGGHRGGGDGIEGRAAEE